jgi:hypothetical protein
LTIVGGIRRMRKEVNILSILRISMEVSWNKGDISGAEEDEPCSRDKCASRLP